MEGMQKSGMLYPDLSRLKVPVYRQPIERHYKVEDNPYGSGFYTLVKKCYHKYSGDCYAAKFISLRRPGIDVNFTRTEAFHEIAVLERCKGCPRILHLHEVYDYDMEIILVMEFACGGDLQSLLDDDIVPDEETVGKFMQQLLQGILFLHRQNIAHLDIKPQNVVLTGTFPQCEVKLCDFENSRLLGPDKEIREIVGTPDYIAPEIIHYDKITLATDMWAIGILTYVLLTGFTPFGGETIQETFLNISQVRLDFPEDMFQDISPEGQDFIASLLKGDPNERLTARQCIEHPWMKSKMWSGQSSLRSSQSQGLSSCQSLRTISGSDNKISKITAKREDNPRVLDRIKFFEPKMEDESLKRHVEIQSPQENTITGVDFFMNDGRMSPNNYDVIDMEVRDFHEDQMEEDETIDEVLLLVEVINDINHKGSEVNIQPLEPSPSPKPNLKKRGLQKYMSSDKLNSITPVNPRTLRRGESIASIREKRLCLYKFNPERQPRIPEFKRETRKKSMPGRPPSSNNQIDCDAVLSQLKSDSNKPIKKPQSAHRVIADFSLPEIPQFKSDRHSNKMSSANQKGSEAPAIPEIHQFKSDSNKNTNKLSSANQKGPQTLAIPESSQTNLENNRNTNKTSSSPQKIAVSPLLSRSRERQLRKPSVTEDEVFQPSSFSRSSFRQSRKNKINSENNTKELSPARNEVNKIKNASNKLQPSVNCCEATENIPEPTQVKPLPERSPTVNVSDNSSENHVTDSNDLKFKDESDKSYMNTSQLLVRKVVSGSDESLVANGSKQENKETSNEVERPVSNHNESSCVNKNDANEITATHTVKDFSTAIQQCISSSPSLPLASDSFSSNCSNENGIKVDSNSNENLRYNSPPKDDPATTEYASYPVKNDRDIYSNGNNEPEKIITAVCPHKDPEPEEDHNKCVTDMVKEFEGKLRQTCASHLSRTEAEEVPTSPPSNSTQTIFTKLTPQRRKSLAVDTKDVPLPDEPCHCLPNSCNPPESGGIPSETEATSEAGIYSGSRIKGTETADNKVKDTLCDVSGESIDSQQVTQKEYKTRDSSSEIPSLVINNSSSNSNDSLLDNETSTEHNNVNHNLSSGILSRVALPKVPTETEKYSTGWITVDKMSSDDVSYRYSNGPVELVTKDLYIMDTPKIVVSEEVLPDLEAHGERIRRHEIKIAITPTPGTKIEITQSPDVSYSDLVQKSGSPNSSGEQINIVLLPAPSKVGKEHSVSWSLPIYDTTKSLSDNNVSSTSPDEVGEPTPSNLPKIEINKMMLKPSSEFSPRRASMPIIETLTEPVEADNDSKSDTCDPPDSPVTTEMKNSFCNVRGRSQSIGGITYYPWTKVCKGSYARAVERFNKKGSQVKATDGKSTSEELISEKEEASFAEEQETMEKSQ